MNNSGYNGRFHEDYEVLKDEARKFPKGVEFEHVFGHEGEPGNEAKPINFTGRLIRSLVEFAEFTKLQANELARQATAPARAMRSVSVPPSYRFHSGSSNQNRSRSRSRNARSRSRSRSRNRISNDCREHQCRSRSAFVAGGNRSKH